MLDAAQRDNLDGRLVSPQIVSLFYVCYTKLETVISSSHICAICKFAALDGIGLQMHWLQSPYCGC